MYVILQQLVLLTKVALFEPIVTQPNKSKDAVKTFLITTQGTLRE